MARSAKRGLDSFPLDVDIFSDERIVAISGAYGIKGEITIVHLLCAIYRNGYFIDWDKKLCLDLEQDLPGVSKNLICDIVTRLVKFGFFDANMFYGHSVLTSVGIQRRYRSVVRRNRSVIPDDMPYLLISMEKPTKAKKSTPTPKPSAVAEQPVYGASLDSRSIEDKVAEIKCQTAWLDQMQMVFHIPSEDILKSLDDFIPFCHAYGYDHSSDSIGELKRHFCNWMRRRPKTEIEQAPPKETDYTYDGGFGSIDI